MRQHQATFLINFPSRVNMAFLHSNTGKLMRLCAQVYGNSTKVNSDDERGQFTQQEETYFKKVFNVVIENQIKK